MKRNARHLAVFELKQTINDCLLGISLPAKEVSEILNRPNSVPEIIRTVVYRGGHNHERPEMVRIEEEADDEQKIKLLYLFNKHLEMKCDYPLDALTFLSRNKSIVPLLIQSVVLKGVPHYLNSDLVKTTTEWYKLFGSFARETDFNQANFPLEEESSEVGYFAFTKVVSGSEAENNLLNLDLVPANLRSAILYLEKNSMKLRHNPVALVGVKWTDEKNVLKIVTFAYEKRPMIVLRPYHSRFGTDFRFMVNVKSKT